MGQHFPIPSGAKTAIIESVAVKVVLVQFGSQGSYRIGISEDIVGSQSISTTLKSLSPRCTCVHRFCGMVEPQISTDGKLTAHIVYFSANQTRYPPFVTETGVQRFALRMAKKANGEKSAEANNKTVQVLPESYRALPKGMASLLVKGEEVPPEMRDVLVTDADKPNRYNVLCPVSELDAVKSVLTGPKFKILKETISGAENQTLTISAQNIRERMLENVRVRPSGNTQHE